MHTCNNPVMLEHAVTPRKAKEILEASLEHSSLPLGYLKVMAVGVARAGKTLTKKHIFHMECDPNSSFSTGACEEPVMALRSVNWEMIQVNLPSLKGFVPLEQDDINRIVARKLHEGSHQGKVAKVVEDIVMSSVSSTLSDASESLPTSSLRSIPEDVFDLQTSVTENLSTHEVAAKSNGSSSSGSGIKAETAPNTTSLSSEGESRATQAVVNALITASSERAKLEAEASKRYRSLHVEDQLYGLQVILYFDSGGQPQFHEIVAAFSHNICLVLIFVKLNESLDALCNNALTDAEGESFKEQCPSLLTNKEMVAQFVHTMMCKPISGSADFQTRFMVIGTHKDLMHECKNESLAQKNEKLAELLLPTLKEVLIMNGDDVIFAVNVNSKELGEEDSVCFDLIRQEISDLKAAVQVNTPVSFLMLFTDVKKYGEQEGKRVLSVQECQDIAGGLKMDRPTLEAALIHFNNMSMWMYIPSVLPGMVFIDPQMLLDSVNRIVQFSYQVGGGKVVGLTPTELEKWREGKITSGILKGKEFTSCFVKKVFEPDDALRLFQSLYIVAPLDQTEYIMPATLPTIQRSDLEDHLVTCSQADPLFLHFKNSRIANGVFCSAHACLRSKYEWTTSYTIRRGKRSPACLFRNAVKLQHPIESIEIVFINALTHFEVYIDLPQDVVTSIACHEIRDMLLDAVNSAADAFRYKNSGASVLL